MKILSVAGLILALSLVACGGGNQSPGVDNGDISGGNDKPVGGGDGGGGGNPPTQSAECGEPTDAEMPASPAPGTSRAGLSCAIHIPIPANMEIPGNPTGVIAFQVFEPTLFEGGEKYPLVLEGHGFSQSRQTEPSDTGTAGLSVPNGPILDAGYGVISIDQAGHGESGGLIRLLDPDQEGQFLIAMLDWAEQNLDWLATGPDDDAGEENMLLGAVGPSYGGGYQMLLHAVDPKKRLDVIVPQITWNDLSYSLFPGTVPKSLWATALFGLGNTAGNDLNRGNFDPFVQRIFIDALAQGGVSDVGLDYTRYRGLGYFCDAGQTPLLTGTNGDDGTATAAGTPYNVDYASPMSPSRINAFIFQGMRDPLFNFNESFATYQCLKNQGGDVRLLTYQNGHNTIPVAPDTWVDPQNSLIGTCGAIDPTEVAVKVFDRYLKGDTSIDLDAELTAPDEICMSLHGTDAVAIKADDFPKGSVNTVEKALPASTLIVGVTPTQTLNVTAVPVDYDFTADGGVLAGIPLLDINVEVQLPLQTQTLCGNGGDIVALLGENADAICSSIGDDDKIVVFAGIAVNATADDSGAFGQGWVLEDNQVYPIRGSGRHVIELVGIGARLNEGAQIGVAFFGLHEQFVAEGGLNAGSPTVLPVEITGSVHMPLLTGDKYRELSIR